MTDLDLPVPSDASGLKRCPWCAEAIRAEAVKCRFCGSALESDSMRFFTEPWLRPREGRMLAGVCAGLAEQFGISVTIVRLAFVLGAFFTGGVFLIAYLGLWLAMPEGDGSSRPRRLDDGADPPGLPPPLP
ncbi:MAG TPA: PspC domain-containing protein [Myxococcota bacterium]|jgi:phage shock protein PspC (stress-responsive transcriptional regulator)|nr:PspC domain-containing protein [Myxococcota bacterium]